MAISRALVTVEDMKSILDSWVIEVAEDTAEFSQETTPGEFWETLRVQQRGQMI